MNIFACSQNSKSVKAKPYTGNELFFFFFKEFVTLGKAIQAITSPHLIRNDIPKSVTCNDDKIYTVNFFFLSIKGIP